MVGHLRKISHFFMLSLFLMTGAAAHAREVVIVDGLPDRLSTNILPVFKLMLGEIAQTSTYRYDALEKLVVTNKDNSTLLALGNDACSAATKINNRPSSVICSLISEYNFKKVLQSGGADGFIGFVIDQPVSRQTLVASKVFNDLSRFSTIESEGSSRSDVSIAGQSISVYRHTGTDTVSDSVRSALRNSDALVAVPDRNIFSKANLKIFLLTAYGLNKPVIGYSRSMVKSGSLITAYSTPTHIANSVKEYLLGKYPPQLLTRERTYFSIYFSIEVNKSLAISLSLQADYQLLTKDTYTDEFSDE